MARRDGFRSNDETPRQGASTTFGLAPHDGSSNEVGKHNSASRAADRGPEQLSSAAKESSDGSPMPQVSPAPDAGFWPWTSLAEQSLWSPQVESFRRRDKLVIRADLPGLQKDDLKVMVEHGVLTISGERRDHRQGYSGSSFTSERSYGGFFRTVTLPDGMDTDACDATFRDGVLEVTISAPTEKLKRGKTVRID